MLRNGKTYASATSSAGSESSYQYPTTITMESTLHKDGVAALTDESFVVDSEIERLTKANDNNIPEVDELQMPGKPDGGDTSPIPALPADAADAIPAKDSLVSNGRFDGSELRTSDVDDQLKERTTRPGYAIGEDGTKHPMVRSASIPETIEPLYQISGPKVFFSGSFASLLEQDAQPPNEEVVGLSDIDCYYDEYLHDMCHDLWTSN